MYILKNYLKAIGVHALCSLGSMMFIMMFPGIIDFTIGQILYSVMTITIFFDVYFTSAWNVSNKELKKLKIHNNHLSDGEQPLKMSYKNGIILTVLIAVTGIILWALSFYFAEKSQGVSTAIFRSWYSEFIVAFMYSVRHIKHVSFAVAIIPAIAYISGFYCGVKNYNFVEEFINKLVYKKKPGKKDENKAEKK